MRGGKGTRKNKEKGRRETKKEEERTIREALEGTEDVGRGRMAERKKGERKERE